MKFPSKMIIIVTVMLSVPVSAQITTWEEEFNDAKEPAPGRITLSQCTSALQTIQQRRAILCNASVHAECTVCAKQTVLCGSCVQVAGPIHPEERQIRASHFPGCAFSILCYWWYPHTIVESAGHLIAAVHVPG
jgi:hypothetical protein